MIEMPPLQFAQTNGIRMGYYEAGPKTDTPPVILCHGWPELAFSWRHQIKALERGRHPRDRAGSARLWRDRPAGAGRGLRHRASDRRSRRPARSSQDRQGDFRRPRLGRLHRLADAAAAPRPRRRRGRHQHAAHQPRAGRSDRAVAQALRRAHVYRPVPGPRARARQDLRQPGRADLRCLHAQAGAARRRAGGRGRSPASAPRRGSIWHFRR